MQQGLVLLLCSKLKNMASINVVICRKKNYLEIKDSIDIFIGVLNNKPGWKRVSTYLPNWKVCLKTN